MRIIRTTQLFLGLIGLLMLFSIAANAEVKTVQMKIAGYLCGN
ncbi:MAG: hypothetical protein WAV20_25385 [Blastocatellia bacterium]